MSSSVCVSTTNFIRGTSIPKFDKRSDMLIDYVNFRFEYKSDILISQKIIFNSNLGGDR